MTKTQIYAVQGVISAAAAAVSAKLGILYPLLLAFAAVMAADFISGMAASAKEALEDPGDASKGWSSRKGMLGILKKFGYILVVAVAVLIDYVILKAGGYLGITAPFKTFFGLLVTIWFILNETLSVLENAGRMGADGMIPDFLLGIIATLKGKVVDKSGSGKDGG